MQERTVPTVEVGKVRQMEAQTNHAAQKEFNCVYLLRQMCLIFYVTAIQNEKKIHLRAMN